MRADLTATKKSKYKIGVLFLEAGAAALILGSVMVLCVSCKKSSSVQMTDSKKSQMPTAEENKERETEFITEAEQNKETETATEKEQLTDEYILCYESIDIDGTDNKGTVYFRELFGGGGGESELSLWIDGEQIWRNDNRLGISTAHVGQTSYYLVDYEGRTYFMEYNPYVGRGLGTLDYEIFSVDANGNETTVEKGDIVFDLKNNGAAEIRFPVDELLSFAETVEGYIANGSLIVSTVNGVFEYDNSYDKENEIFPYLKSVYPWIYDEAVLYNINLNECSSLEEVLAKIEEGLNSGLQSSFA